MEESWNTRIKRWGFNWFPAFRGTGARLTYIAGDWKEVRLRIPLNWRTRNYVGTIYGGSIYGAVDPVYMIMLIKLLGPGYIVWLKESTVSFLRPGRETLHARFRVDDDHLEGIRRELLEKKNTKREYEIPVTDRGGTPHAVVREIIHIQRKPSGTRVLTKETGGQGTDEASFAIDERRSGGALPER
ncbi:MAG TPA: DUF4442 domain-containing protein [Syntrophales bacterium]|nr:DUF4442 domain-containing protein [Syntrophales bacterium]